MALEVITNFSAEDTVEIWAYVKNQAGSYTDPTAITIDVIDPDGTVQTDDTAMTKSSTGIYYYRYHVGATTAAMDKGNWRGRVKVTDGSGATAIITTQAFGFKVK
jgi:uncharacterized protein YfaS (alpha-2-macroglobulin family)